MPPPRFLFDVDQIVQEGRVKQTDIDKVKSWSLHQKCIPELSEQQIVVFLLSCCNDYECTKSTITAYYTIQQGTPELFNDKLLERDDLQKTLNVIRIGVSPERTLHNCGVLLISLHDTAYYRLDMGPVIKVGMMTLNSMVYDNPPDSFITIIDMKGIGLMHITRVVFRFLKPFFRYVQEALPVRIEEILVINTVYFINKIMAIIKPFMNAKLMEKLHFHTPDMDLELFFKEFLDMQCIPTDYGGGAPSMEELHMRNIKKLEEMEQFFRDDELHRNSVDN